jgi:hypothetical protein
VQSTFEHATPLQSPHASTHFKPFFLHEHRIVSQVFFDDNLQLQRTTFNKNSGAGGRSVLTGFNIPSLLRHPQSEGSNPQSMLSFRALISFK